ncbi:hypothetical protein [Atlantibacter hermannii]|uniref:hypothetical protein n=1 Tax=Atlantibacter hermannii TaxID=565 RepID=UPI0028A7F6F7|nr:hypothetical protein [Atlantibacter hermannii]
MNTTELIATIKPDLAMLCDSEEMTAERYAALSRIVAHLTPPNLLALVEALESAQRKISELESRTVTLPRVQDIHPLGPQSAKMLCEFHRNIVNRCADEVRKAGIKCEVKGE